MWCCTCTCTRDVLHLQSVGDWHSRDAGKECPNKINCTVKMMLNATRFSSIIAEICVSTKLKFQNMKHSNVGLSSMICFFLDTGARYKCQKTKCPGRYIHVHVTITVLLPTCTCTCMQYSPCVSMWLTWA